MNDHTKNIISVNIEDELKTSYLDYAMSVIVGRALPDVRDGLKPVHRRILYAMNILGNDWNKPYKKSARIVGDVIGKYHPHGDTAVYDTIVRMAQPFSLRYMLINGQGNFGSVDGDSAAAMRYTEVRMARISHELLEDLEKETIDFTSNYDNTEKIPTVMPAKFPNLLVNGASGIAVGMATNIPPHNFSEVINGCIAYIDNKDISIEDLMKHIPGPDFPTAAIINGRHGIEEAYRTGRGKIYQRALAKIKIDKKTNRESILICQIPYQVNKARLIEKIAQLVKEKRIEGISALRDESDKDGIRIVIEIKRDSVAEIVLNNLYSLTQLQVTFGINMVALYQGQPQLLNLKDILFAFIQHRREIVTRRTIFELRKTSERIHILEALIIALVNIDLIIRLIRSSLTPISAKSDLITQAWTLGDMHAVFKYSNNIIHSKWLILKNKIYNEKYYFTEQQAEAILDLRLQKLTSLEHGKLLEEYQQLLSSISKLTAILDNSQCLLEVIRKELIDIKVKYHDVRRTKIITDTLDINIEDLINQEDVIVTLSHKGYVKYQPLSDYEAQRRGGKGRSAARIKEKDFIDHLLVANTHDTILCFSSLGRLYWMKVYQFPEASYTARGRPIVNLLPLKHNERITTILPVSQYKKEYSVFMATSNGTVKKTALTEFSRPRNTGIIAVNLQIGDKLIGASLTTGKNEVMLFSSSGKVVRFPESQVRLMGRTARGIRGMNLSLGDKVISLIIPQGKGDILTVTKNGFGKRTAVTAYPIKSRATQGVISIKVNKRNGQVVGAIQVINTDQIMMITNTGTLVRIRVSEVSVIGRNTHGVTLIRTTAKETVVALQRVAESIENEDLLNNIIPNRQ
ncbi:DNA gyrase subunit A [Candidatus Ecksteinia adelgidicola]|nr:DNA gyrase subunit A [Candidatus Ecksteinia adelgidicola]